MFILHGIIVLKIYIFEIINPPMEYYDIILYSNKQIYLNLIFIIESTIKFYKLNIKF